VVARWVHPATRLPHGTFVASSVSGFLFTGNAGNWMSGFTDSTGQPLNRFGSDDTTLEGFFDLGGLQVPSGNSAHYQISVEPINPLWSENAGSYGFDVASQSLRSIHSDQRHGNSRQRTAGHRHAVGRSADSALVGSDELHLTGATSDKWKLAWSAEFLWRNMDSKHWQSAGH